MGAEGEISHGPGTYCENYLNWNVSRRCQSDQGEVGNAVVVAATGGGSAAPDLQTLAPSFTHEEPALSFMPTNIFMAVTPLKSVFRGNVDVSSPV